MRRRLHLAALLCRPRRRPSTPTPSTPPPDSDPALAPAAPPRSSGAPRLNQLARHLNRHSADRALLALLRRLSAAGAEPSPPAVGPSVGAPRHLGRRRRRRDALLAALDEAAAADVETAALRDTGALTELSLLLAIASLDSLDVLVLMLPSDAEALRVARLLSRRRRSCHSSTSGRRRRRRSSSAWRRRRPPTRSRGSRCRVRRDARRERPRRVPNLMAEVLHPLCHWSHELDNSLDEDEE